MNKRKYLQERYNHDKLVSNAQPNIDRCLHVYEREKEKQVGRKNPAEFDKTIDKSTIIMSESEKESTHKTQ